MMALHFYKEPEKHMTYMTEAEWLAANPIRVWRDNQTNQNEVSAPMQTIADATGTTRTSVMNWEQGTFVPKFPSMIKLAELMKYESGIALWQEWQTWLQAKPTTDVQPVAVNT